MATLQPEDAEQRAQIAQLVATMAKLSDRIAEFLAVAQRKQRKATSAQRREEARAGAGNRRRRAEGVLRAAQAARAPGQDEGPKREPRVLRRRPAESRSSAVSRSPTSRLSNQEVEMCRFVSVISVSCMVLAACAAPPVPVGGALGDVDLRGNVCSAAEHPAPAQLIQAPILPDASDVVGSTGTIACVATSPLRPELGPPTTCAGTTRDVFLDGSWGVAYGCPRPEDWCPPTSAHLPVAAANMAAVIAAARDRSARGVWLDGMECGTMPGRSPVATAECVSYFRALIRQIRAAGFMVGGNVNPRTVVGLAGDDRLDIALLELTHSASRIESIGVREARERILALPVRTSPPGRRGIALEHPLRGAQAFAVAAALGPDVAVVLTGAEHRPGCIDPDYPCWGAENLRLPFVRERVTMPCELEPGRFRARFAARRGDVFFNATALPWDIGSVVVRPWRGSVCLDGVCSDEPGAFAEGWEGATSPDAALPRDAGAGTPGPRIWVTSPAPDAVIPLGSSFALTYGSVGLDEARVELQRDGELLPAGLVDLHGPPAREALPVELGPWLSLRVGDRVSIEITGAGARASRTFTVGAAPSTCAATTGTACVVGLGSCERRGTIDCGGNCSATPGAPAPETCGGNDRDCDGAVDEGGVCATSACSGVVIGDPGFERTTAFATSTSRPDAPWVSEVHYPGTAAMTITTFMPAVEGSRVARIDTTTVHSEDWRTQLAQTGIALRARRTYRLSVSIRRASDAASVRVWAGQHGRSWTAYGTAACLVSASTWTPCELTFTAPDDDADAKISVVLGGTVGTTFVDAVTLQECP